MPWHLLSSPTYDRLCANLPALAFAHQTPPSPYLPPTPPQGSTTINGTVVFPPYLQSALLAININTGAITLAAVPDPAPNAGYVSLLGLDLVPPTTVPGSDGLPILVVSDFAGGIRYYNTKTYQLLKTVDTSFIDPDTSSLATLNYGHLRVAGQFIYLAAFNYNAPGLPGLVLRYTLAGEPAGAASGAYAGTPVWIAPSAAIPRAIGLELMSPSTDSSLCVL